MAFTLRFTDAFTEVSDTNLSAHTPNTGASWTQGAGATEAEVDGVTDTAVMDYYTGTVMRIYTADISGGWANDQKATGINATEATLTGSSRTPGVRVSAGDDGYFAGGRSTYVIKGHRVDNNALTEILSHTATISSTDRIGLQFVGSTGQLELNGTLVGSTVSDSTYATGSVGCLFSHAYTGDGLDDFEGSDEGAGVSIVVLRRRVEGI